MSLANMFEKAPTSFRLAVLLCVLLAGPIAVFSFLLGGVYVGSAAVLLLFFLYIILYMIAVRRYT